MKMSYGTVSMLNGGSSSVWYEIDGTEADLELIQSVCDVERTKKALENGANPNIEMTMTKGEGKAAEKKVMTPLMRLVTLEPFESEYREPYYKKKIVNVEIMDGREVGRSIRDDREQELKEKQLKKKLDDEAKAKNEQKSKEIVDAAEVLMQAGGRLKLGGLGFDLSDKDWEQIKFPKVKEYMLRAGLVEAALMQKYNNGHRWGYTEEDLKKAQDQFVEDMTKYRTADCPTEKLAELIESDFSKKKETEAE